jgi:hypothetical protein
VSGRRGRPSNRCYPTALRADVIGIIRERYSDFGPTLAAEKLAELHDIHLAHETVRQWMIVAGLWRDRRARLKAVHQPRYRHDCLGELIQIDGSEHLWFEGRGPQCAASMSCIRPSQPKTEVPERALASNVAMTWIFCRSEFTVTEETLIHPHNRRGR